MSFEQEFIHGYKQYSKHFDKWCEQANFILGNVTQCGITEFDESGHAWVATNRPDYGEHYISNKGYILDKKWVYSPNFPEGFLTYCSNDGIQFLQENENSLFGKKFDVWSGFSFFKKVDNNIYRQFFFSADTPEIYDNLLNNVNLVKKFIQHFEKENQHIINYFRDRKFNIAEKKEDYFADQDNFICSQERENTVNMLHTLGILDQKKNISNREWQCIELYRQGKSATQTGKILGISNRTVETNFNNLKQKLNVNTKAELIDKIN